MFIKRKNRREEAENCFVVSVQVPLPHRHPHHTYMHTHTHTHTFMEEVNSIPHFLYLAQIKKVECPVICINSRNDL